MTTNAEIANATTLRVLVRLHEYHPSPVDVSWASVIDSEMERVFATYDESELRIIVSDTIQRLLETGIISGEVATEARTTSDPPRIRGATLSNRAFQVLELVDGDCGGIVADQAKVALTAANSRAIRVIGERLAGFLLA